jgi:hypothetical protein
MRLDSDLAQYFSELEDQYNLPINIISSVAQAESNFNPDAVSPKGATGMFQFMPDTARHYGVRDPRDPYESAQGAARYLADLQSQFGDTKLTLAAYNAGEGAVKKYGGVPPYSETRGYVDKVMSSMGGRSEQASESPVNPYADLYQKMGGVPKQEVGPSKVNPYADLYEELKRPEPLTIEVTKEPERPSTLSDIVSPYIPETVKQFVRAGAEEAKGMYNQLVTKRPERPPTLSEIVSPYVPESVKQSVRAGAEEAKSMYNQLGANALHAFQWIGTWNPDVPAVERDIKPSGWELLLNQKAQEHASRATGLSPDTILGKTLETIAATTLEMPAYAASYLLGGTPGYVALSALEKADQGIAAMGKAAATSLAAGKAGESLAGLPLWQRALGMGEVGAGTNYLLGGTPKDIAASFLANALLGTTLPGPSRVLPQATGEVTPAEAVPRAIIPEEPSYAAQERIQEGRVEEYPRDDAQRISPETGGRRVAGTGEAVKPQVQETQVARSPYADLFTILLGDEYAQRQTTTPPGRPGDETISSSYDRQRGERISSGEQISPQERQPAAYKQQPIGTIRDSTSEAAIYPDDIYADATALAEEGKAIDEKVTQADISQAQGAQGAARPSTETHPAEDTTADPYAQDHPGTVRSPLGRVEELTETPRSPEPGEVPGVNPLTGEAMLGMGVSPRQAAQALPWSMADVLEGIEQKQPKSFIDSLKQIFAPATRGKYARTTAGIIRSNLAQRARSEEQAWDRIYRFAKAMGQRPSADNYRFIDDIEEGRPVSGNKMEQAAATTFRELLDDARKLVQSLGKGYLDHFYENYFPRFWAETATSGEVFGRRPLTGAGGFLKQRTYTKFMDGIDAGLTPLTDNPAAFVLLKLREMNRFYWGQRLFLEMKDAGLAKFVRFGERAPDGWIPLDDKIAKVRQFSESEKGLIERGKYYAPEQAATLFNNHLSPGLRGNGVYDFIRKSGNALNQLQLGFSGFHLGFEIMDAMNSKLALGVQQASRGSWLSAIKNSVETFTGIAPFTTYLKGRKVFDAFMHGTSDPALTNIVKAVVEGGGRVKQDPFYRNSQPGALREAIQRGEYLKAARKFLPSVLDQTTSWLFEHVVPKMKLGVFYDLAQDALVRRPNMNLTEQREVFGRLWDSVDNRMGQMVYDNIFWDRTLKDVLMTSVRSVGWNLGTIRELGGGVRDLFDVKQLRADKQLSQRTAYVMALPIMTGFYGAIYQYLATGKPPESVNDLYNPRNGKMRGNEEDRILLPSYMKDVYAYYKAPWQTVKNKLAPQWAMVAQMLDNKDFYGAQIRNQSDPLVQQLKDEANFLINNFIPFSIRNARQQNALEGINTVWKNYLISPSMIGITPAPASAIHSAERQAQINRIVDRDAVIKKAQQEYVAGNQERTNELLRSVAPTKDAANWIRRQKQSFVRSAQSHMITDPSQRENQ